MILNKSLVTRHKWNTNDKCQSWHHGNTNQAPISNQIIRFPAQLPVLLTAPPKWLLGLEKGNNLIWQRQVISAAKRNRRAVCKWIKSRLRGTRATCDARPRSGAGRNTFGSPPVTLWPLNLTNASQANSVIGWMVWCSVKTHLCAVQNTMLFWLLLKKKKKVCELCSPAWDVVSGELQGGACTLGEFFVNVQRFGVFFSRMSQYLTRARTNTHTYIWYPFFILTHTHTLYAHFTCQHSHTHTHTHTHTTN